LLASVATVRDDEQNTTAPGGESREQESAGQAMRYLVVRTDVRRLAPEDLSASLADGGRARDERTAPEPRRQTASADSLDVALRLARALASVGPVRAGRQRVKVLRLG
jgi:hypothetical protein